jgi:hypothetical protein
MSQIKRKAPACAGALVSSGYALSNRYVCRLQTLGPLLDSELDALTFFQCSEAFRLDRRVMNKDVITIFNPMKP